MSNIKLVCGDSLIELDKLEENSVHSIVIDPPYHLTSAKNSKTGFMGKEWDGGDISFRSEIWEKALRVIKPGGYLLSFASTRTMHRIATAIETAGFEIRDCIVWHYASGFPHGSNIGKAVDKLQSNDREVVGKTIHSRKGVSIAEQRSVSSAGSYGETREGDITKGNSAFEGFNTNLKPATELIIVARKNITEKTIAKNCLKHGVGALNIDACRIAGDVPFVGGSCGSGEGYKYKKQGDNYKQPIGRYPANVIFECICSEVIPGKKGKATYDYTNKKEYNVEGFIPNIKPNSPSNRGDTNPIHTNPACPCFQLNQQSGNVKGWSGQKHNNFNPYGGNSLSNSKTQRVGNFKGYNDKGGASRFFKTIEDDMQRFYYVAKAGKKEKNAGLEDMPVVDKDTRTDTAKGSMTTKGLQPARNFHPTVKPVKILEYLITLVTPPGGTVLDFFMGSGSCGIAAQNLGFSYIGIELEKDYYEIAVKRIAWHKKEMENQADLNQDIFSTDK